MNRKKNKNYPQEYDLDHSIVSMLDEINEEERMILEIKQCSNDLDIITYMFSSLLNSFTNYHKKQ